MIRLKQVNIELCRTKHRLKRNQAMSLYDEKTDQTLKERQSEITKDKTETWNKWRVLMKTKSILFILILLITISFGNIVEAATDGGTVGCPRVWWSCTNIG